MPEICWVMLGGGGLKGGQAVGKTGTAMWLDTGDVEAAQALWTKASYYKVWGNGKYAIGSARQLLKAYPKSQWASRAHQMLEAYGVKTGGGVVDGEN